MSQENTHKILTPLAHVGERGFYSVDCLKIVSYRIKGGGINANH